MRKFGWLLGVMIVLPLICVAQVGGEPTENPDEYRDCVVYTLEEAMENSASDNNILIFTYSDKTTRAFHTNADCKIVKEEEITPPPSSDNTDIFCGHSGGSCN